MDDSQLRAELAQAKRAAQANGQALSEKVAELAYARPMADAAQNVIAVWDLDERQFHVWENWPELAKVLLGLLVVREATTPSEVPSSHVIVERAELERLRAIEKCAQDMAAGPVVGNASEWVREAAREILGAGA